MTTFHALAEGRVLDGSDPRTLTMHDLGFLRVPSGRLEASDPFVNLGKGVEVGIPPGDYPVRVTVADVSDEQDGSHQREAYLSVVLADGDPVRAQLAHRRGIMVDAGTVAFADAQAVATCMPADPDWYENLFDDGSDSSWFSRMDDPAHLRHGCANIVMPLATSGENVILAHSGWGDGIFPLVQTFNRAGTLLAMHIDLYVVGGEDDIEPLEIRGWFRKLLGR